MSLTFCYWSAWPNRHLDPFLDEAFRSGALQRVVYADKVHEHQLGGTPPRRDPEREVILEGDRDWRRTARLVLDTPCDFHLMYGFVSTAVRFAMNTCAKRGIPYLFAGESLQPRGRFEARTIARQVLYRYLLRGAAGVFAVGTRAADDFERLGLQRSQVSPFMYAGPRCRPYRAPAHPEEIAYCGRLIELKGLDVLADALLALRQRGTHLSLSVLGSGRDDAPLARLTAAGVRVERHGAVAADRVPELVGRAAALVLPTKRREGWGYVVNEAIALGVPPVVSDAVGARELIAPGWNGDVYRTCDASGLADALVATLGLHRDAARLGQSLALVQNGLDPGRFTHWFMLAAAAALSGHGKPPWAPWLAAAEAAGGNTDTGWWRSWRSWADPAQAAG